LNVPVGRLVIEALGWMAMALIVGAYFLSTIGRVDSRSRLYQWMNVIGAAGFIVNSGWNGAYPSAALNIIWAAIGIYALTRPTARG
jgi:hypothetical protein